MDIKKIVKRNLRNMSDAALRLALKPFVYGFTHASYVYFYLTHHNCDDEHLEYFLVAQGRGFKDLCDDALDKLYDTLDKDEDPEKWENRIMTLWDIVNLYSWFPDKRLLERTMDNIKENGCVQYGDRAVIRRMEEKYEVRRENG